MNLKKGIMDIKKKDLHRTIIGYGVSKVGTIKIATVKAYYEELTKLYYVIPIESIRKFNGTQYAVIYGKKNKDYFEYKTFSGCKNKIKSFLK